MNEELVCFYNKNRFNITKAKGSDAFIDKINALTIFLDEHYINITISQRIWHVKNSRFHVENCIICGKPCSYIKGESNYSNTCSRSCSQKYSFMNGNRKIKTKTKKIKKERNISLSNERRAETCMEKYGVDNYSKSEEYKSCLDSHVKKHKASCMEKYGVDNYSKHIDQEEKTIVKCKIESTNIVRYGEKYYLNTEEAKENNTKIVSLQISQKLKQDGYEELGYKFIKTNGKRNHVIYCPSCKKEFVTESRLYYHRKLCNHEICTNCNKTKKPYSSSEKELLDFVKSFYFGEIIENSRSIIKPYELDIYLPELRIAIEYNGDYWHANPKIYKDSDVMRISKNMTEIKACDIWKKDKNKNEVAKDKNIKLITIWESDWINDNKNEMLKIQNVIKNEY